jgi:hypothetical protein
MIHNHKLLIQGFHIKVKKVRPLITYKNPQAAKSCNYILKNKLGSSKV